MLRCDVSVTRPVSRVGSLALYSVHLVAEASGSVELPTAIVLLAQRGGHELSLDTKIIGF